MAKSKPIHNLIPIQNTRTEFNPKALDIFVKYIEQTLKNVDTSILLAFTIAAFLLIPGLEGSFSAEIRDTAVAEIPFLNFRADLLTAAIFGLALYWIFCFRAVFQISQARDIAEKLRSADASVLDAVLHFPSIATSTIQAKCVTCFSLALLGMASWILMYISTFGVEDILWGALSMGLPPMYLLYGMWKPFNSPIDES